MSAKSRSKKLDGKLAALRNEFKKPNLKRVTHQSGKIVNMIDNGEDVVQRTEYSDFEISYLVERHFPTTDFLPHVFDGWLQLFRKRMTEEHYPDSFCASDEGTLSDIPAKRTHRVKHDMQRTEGEE